MGCSGSYYVGGGKNSERRRKNGGFGCWLRRQLDESRVTLLGIADRRVLGIRVRDFLGYTIVLTL